MTRTRIKICGLTDAGQTRAAVAAGADAVGLVFARSSRHVSIEEGRAVVSALPPFVARIGVFVDADRTFVESAVAGCGLTAIQYCGSESPDECAHAPAPVIKVIKVEESFDWAAAAPYRGSVAALLLDTGVAGMAGGTAQPFDWASVGAFPDWAPVIVAGGLHPGNVPTAVRMLRPFAVDVSSGVESAPGVKDTLLMQRFCAAVRAADEEVA